MPDECTGDKGFSVVAFMWDIPAPNMVLRTMFRRCNSCGALDATELRWVNPEQLWCQACLSQAVVPLAYANGHKQWQCMECRAISGEVEVRV